MAVQLINAQAIIDGVGNIQAHGRAGLNFAYSRLVGGTAQDISADALFFEIDGVLRQALGEGATNTVRTIAIEPAVIAQLPLRTPTAFCLRDETGDPPVSRWDGYIMVRGFEVEPT